MKKSMHYLQEITQHDDANDDSYIAPNSQADDACNGKVGHLYITFSINLQS